MDCKFALQSYTRNRNILEYSIHWYFLDFWKAFHFQNLFQYQRIWYDSNTNNRAHAGSKNFNKITKFFLQAVGVRVSTNCGDVSVFAIYSPPRHFILYEDLQNFFSNLVSRFLVAVDFNVKHPWWGSRLTNPKGRELYKCILKKKTI